MSERATSVSADVEAAARELAERASHAVETGHPLLVLVLYAGESRKTAFLQHLQSRLSERGLLWQRLDPARRAEHGAGKFYQVVEGAGPDCISLVSSLPPAQAQAGLDAEFLAYLNLHRDRIASYKLRIVLCVHRDDAASFAGAAGDLWDFRQRTIRLEEPVEPPGREFWLQLDTAVRKLPLPEDQRAAVEQHVSRVRAQVAETRAARDRARMSLDLAQWLLRREAGEAAVQAAAAARAEAADPSLQAEAAATLGAALLASKQFRAALEPFERSLALSLELQAPLPAAAALRGIARVQQSLGNTEPALASLVRSLEYSRQAGDLNGEAAALDAVAQIQFEQGRLDNALATLAEHVSIVRRIGDRRAEAAAHLLRAKVHIAAGRLLDAQADSARSVQLRAELHDGAGEAAALVTLALACWGLARLDEAAGHLRRAQALYAQADDPPTLAMVLNNLALVQIAQGRSTEAAVHLEQGLATLDASGDAGRKAVVLRNLSRVREQQGDLRAALAHAQGAVELIERLGDDAAERRLLDEERARIAGLRAALGAVLPHARGSGTPPDKG